MTWNETGPRLRNGSFYVDCYACRPDGSCATRDHQKRSYDHFLEYQRLVRNGTPLPGMTEENTQHMLDVYAAALLKHVFPIDVAELPPLTAATLF